MTRYVPFTSVTHSYHIWHCTLQVRFIIQTHPPGCTINRIWTRYTRIIRHTAEYGRQFTGDRFISRQFHTMCKSPGQQTSQTPTGMSTHSNNSHNTLQQNVAQGQPPATNQQTSKQSTCAHQQQSSLLWPPAPGSYAAPGHQGQSQFIQPMVSP